MRAQFLNHFESWFPEKSRPGREGFAGKKKRFAVERSATEVSFLERVIEHFAVQQPSENCVRLEAGLWPRTAAF
jgi:hypothetical protein